MTYSPQSLLDLRRYLQQITGLDASSLGIQHFSAQGGGYHEGWDLLQAGYGWDDYSVSESPRDAHPSNGASAIDIGDFAVTGPDGRHVTLRGLTVWLVGQCQAGAADTRDIREIIYTPDGSTVKRWDRQGVRSGGDSSHLYHTHVSYFRDAEGRDKTALFRRYFEGDHDMDSAAYEWFGSRFGDLWNRIGGLQAQVTRLAGVVAQMHLESRNTESLVTQGFTGEDRPSFHDEMVGYTYLAHINATAGSLIEALTALKTLTDETLNATVSTEGSGTPATAAEPGTTEPDEADSTADNSGDGSVREGGHVE